MKPIICQEMKPRDEANQRTFFSLQRKVCRLICVTIRRPYSTTNEGDVWALQRTKKPAGLRLSVLTIKSNLLPKPVGLLDLEVTFCVCW